MAVSKLIPFSTSALAEPSDDSLYYGWRTRLLPDAKFTLKFTYHQEVVAAILVAAAPPGVPTQLMIYLLLQMFKRPFIC
jgi:hypothetical protein